MGVADYGGFYDYDERVVAVHNHLGQIWTYLYETVANGKEYPIKSEEALMVMEVISEIKNQNGDLQ